MFFEKENICQTRSSSVTSNRTASKKKSLLKIPSTSKIPKDFFRQSVRQRECFPENSEVENSLQITFMPQTLKKSFSSVQQLRCKADPSFAGPKRIGLVKRMGLRIYQKQNLTVLDQIGSN